MSEFSSMSIQRCGILLWLWMCSLTPLVWGQAGSGEITGQVFDNSRAAIESAKVTATNADTGEIRSTLAASGGVYAFSSLEPGSYRLQVEATGFRSQARSEI